jgi:phosphoribosyl 1,2-cyclic phosphate phosphodiesterase
LRTSLLIEKEDKKILIETTPDLRQQLLLAGSPRIDSVIWSHGHYDHFMGFGEFYRVQDLPHVFGGPGVIAYCGSIFGFMGLSASIKKAFQPFRVCDLSHALSRQSPPLRPDW